MDRSVIGRQGKPFEMVVELGKIREFARATRSSNSAYLESPEPVSPPTFLMTTSFWTDESASPWAGSGVQLDLKRLLHGEQEFVFHGPPPAAGARLTGVTRVDDVYEKEGKRGGTMTFIVLVTTFSNEAGAVVAEARLTLIETGRPTTD